MSRGLIVGPGSGSGTTAPVAPLWQTADSATVTIPRLHLDDSNSYGQNVPSGTEHLTLFRADKSVTVNTIRFQTAGQAAASSTVAQVGLYTVAGGTFTLVASSANQTTFSGTYANQTCALTSSYNLVAGTTYAIGILQVATTVASLFGAWFNPVGLGATPIIAQTKSGQANIAATITGASGNAFPLYYEIL